MSVVEDYLAGQDDAAHSVVRALDAAVRAAEPGFDVAVKYRMLMYTLDAQWRNWVVAVGTSTRGVQLRFLQGVLLDDPLHVLRAGSSHLMTWDFAFGAEVEADAVAGYVRDAVAERSRDFSPKKSP